MSSLRNDFSSVEWDAISFVFTLLLYQTKIRLICLWSSVPQMTEHNNRGGSLVKKNDAFCAFALILSASERRDE
ncbi:hypothetical protein CEXT_40901 [Caerostris extrusa]|uniref:Uncharacterized protein n=1 Tax=Caerostris extrusa TaxID=172846 RepID=A0AAV4XP47_CAEEX|nr:hypothetical protein CEXT_40901 [Caerostris extrusa]